MKGQFLCQEEFFNFIVFNYLLTGFFAESTKNVQIFGFFKFLNFRPSPEPQNRRSRISEIVAYLKSKNTLITAERPAAFPSLWTKRPLVHGLEQ
jgi:hypothetical protein